MIKGFNKVKGLLMAGLISLPMVGATTMLSHADSSNELHDSYKTTIMIRLGLTTETNGRTVVDNRITDRYRERAAQQIERATSDDNLTDIYKEALRLSLDQKFMDELKQLQDSNPQIPRMSISDNLIEIFKASIPVERENTVVNTETPSTSTTDEKVESDVHVDNEKSNNGNHYGQLKNGNNGNHFGQTK